MKNRCVVTPRRLPKDPKRGREHLSAVDSVMARAIKECGTLPDRSQPATLLTLCRSVIGQQVSTKAAQAIYLRFLALTEAEEDVAPDLLLELSEEALRGVGLSRAKVVTVKGLAEVWQRESLSATDWGKLPDDQIMALLLPIKGIGPWTVKMFLMFALRRPDVLPQEDLGLRAGLMSLHGLETMPTPKETVLMTEKWAPYRTLGTLYSWHWLHHVRGD